MQSEYKPVIFLLRTIFTTPLRKFGGASVPPARHYVPFFESLMWLTQQQPKILGVFSRDILSVILLQSEVATPVISPQFRLL